MAYQRVDMSYGEAYDRLKGTRDPAVLDAAHPKVSQALQAKEAGAARIPFSDVWATPKVGACVCVCVCFVCVGGGGVCVSVESLRLLLPSVARPTPNSGSCKSTTC